jgi:hypothetical protein
MAQAQLGMIAVWNRERKQMDAAVAGTPADRMQPPLEARGHWLKAES